MKELLEKIFIKWCGQKAESITPLPQSGSPRQYFRIKSKEHSAIGVFNADRKENLAFINFTNHFLNHNLNVPKIFSADIDNNVYLIEDLGNQTLFNFLEQNRNSKGFATELTKYYKTALEKLIDFQVKTSRDFNYSVCYPREEFDKQSMMWDLNYFKYFFLKTTNTSFDEQKLEDDFNSLTEFLFSAQTDFFLYRDFQSRNIMLKDDALYFIDYQGGRKGALQYDVASLLYDAKADIPQRIRNELLEYYLSELVKSLKVEVQKFHKHYYGYVLVRILQALGAYGFRGLHERKSHFLQSIPFALKNISFLLSNKLLPADLFELNKVLNYVCENKSLKTIETPSISEKLVVTINSFSYKSGIPIDYSGNDGGFVFDCRALHNPGRYDKYKMLTGKDKEVINFLETRNDVKEFIDDVKSITKRAVENYHQRNFSNLMVSFGCTGGQHRSVYCAEELSKYLNTNFDVVVNLNHTELDKKG